MRFLGKTALITGAASGIGRATALRLAAEGCRVACLDLNAEGLASLEKSIISESSTLQSISHSNDLPSNSAPEGRPSSLESEARPSSVDSEAGRAIFCEGSIGIQSDVEGFVADAIENFGRIDFLFNNAGIEFVSPLDETDVVDWDAVYDINVKGNFLMTKAVLPHMRSIGGGAIVNNASDAGLRGIRLNAAYSSSKAALIHLSKSIALDYGQYNIRCNCICPGCIKTPLCERFNAEVGAREGISGEKALQQFVEQNIPMLRVGMPEEVASVVAFLFSDEARYVSGSVITIDGGLTAGM